MICVFLRIFSRPIIVVIILIGLSGCVTTLDDWKQGPRSLMANGLISTQFGDGLDTAAKRKALDAEIKALASGNTGAAVKWQGNDSVNGSVTPGQPFEVSGRTCRRYNHVIVVGGVSRSSDATACLNEEGLWEPLV